MFKQSPILPVALAASPARSRSGLQPVRLAASPARSQTGSQPDTWCSLVPFRWCGSERLEQEEFAFEHVHQWVDSKGNNQIDTYAIDLRALKQRNVATGVERKLRFICMISCSV